MKSPQTVQIVKNVNVRNRDKKQIAGQGWPN